ncbi:MAG: response regulator transcription factor [Gemmatimonadaceae bacterium]|nr:response regulator transcription factor [Chitinophagaceae bacterium]
MPSTISLVIADDHEIFRDGLALMLSKQKHFELVGQAEDGNELMEIAAEKLPDVILTDIKMPRMDGIDATRRLLAVYPKMKFIALSMFDEENLIVEMLEAGAKGYLLKNADKTEIIEAIEQVAAGHSFYCKHTSIKLASMIVKSKFNPYRKVEPVVFSDRELEVIRLICRQDTTQQIGDKLFLSKRTVEGYRTRILEKMNVRNTAGVVIYALKNGLVKEEEL